MYRTLFALLIGCFLIGAGACVSGPADREPSVPPAGSWQVPEEKPVENSGRSLAGEYIVRDVRDEYLARNASTKIGTHYVFNSDGTFKRQRPSAGPSAGVVEGSYVIGTGNEMVLYIERVGGAPVGTALVERYTIDQRPDGTVELKYGASGVIALARA
jgi:hypothetical protein